MIYLSLNEFLIRHALTGPLCQGWNRLPCRLRLTGMVVKVGTKPIQQEILVEVNRLPFHTLNEGTPGRDLLRFAGVIPPEEGELMKRAIEDACERVDTNEW
ncbi:hypothetical protein Desku_2403 [Desulfofundulus kuznetsovii DSM 6115]|uniref:Uncharacterized protein n=2 Tax=Desulfofundulus kuznetsovii TaxID=58135 RepID=A0AAU8PJE4_DESK7|nr:hypothetical protein Desku_2403 [Desulfofundulus kuznetsovii DSM 6115]